MNRLGFDGSGDGCFCVVGGGVLLSHTLAGAVPLALAGLASGFGMGPGVSLSLWPPPTRWLGAVCGVQGS